MRFTNISDLHLSDKRPKYRIDPDYLDTCYSKLEKILDHCVNTGCKVLVIGGDIFDYPTVPRHVVTDIQYILTQYGIRVLVIPGQHDLRYHAKGIKNTPLGNIVSSGLMELLLPDKAITIEGVRFIGQGWEEKVSCSGDVLVTHQMVTKKGPLWPGQSDFISAPGILNQHKEFQCVLSGDNHKPHYFVSKDGRLQINGGAIMRSSKDQVDFKPRIWTIETDDWSFKVDELQVESAKEVFNFSKMATDETKELARKESQEKIDAFVDSFDQAEGEKTDFKIIVKRVIEDVKPNEAVKNIINNILETVSNKGETK